MGDCRSQRRKVAGKKIVPVLGERKRRRPNSSPPGFTLVELLLVLVLLTVMASLAALALRRPFANQRLVAAADLVRTQWCLARNEAIRSGSTYAFQCVLGGSSFRIQLDSEEPDDETLAWEEQHAAGLPPARSAKDRPTLSTTAQFLPEHLIFATIAMNVDSAADTTGLERQLLKPATAGWSDSICFYPDGTTSDARVVLVNDHGSRVELALRGLTGTVVVGGVQALQEPLP